MENAPLPTVKRSFPIWLIVLLVILAACILIPICIIVILALLGPSIGNVFSEIIQNLGTPVP